jgi:hypothetical protein
MKTKMMLTSGILMLLSSVTFSYTADPINLRIKSPCTYTQCIYVANDRLRRGVSDLVRYIGHEWPYSDCKKISGGTSCTPVNAQGGSLNMATRDQILTNLVRDAETGSYCLLIIEASSCGFERSCIFTLKNIIVLSDQDEKEARSGKATLVVDDFNGYHWEYDQVVPEGK